MASTGGPNTLVATAATDAVLRAARDSAAIEHAGQVSVLSAPRPYGVRDAACPISTG